MEASASKEKFKEICCQEDILRDEWLTEEYQLSNRATPAASVDNIVDDPGLKDNGVHETTGVDSDFFHRQYDSPIKQKLEQLIQELDAEST